jgi:dephospho-CoA kinase
VLTVGLTGGIGAGKSTVGRAFGACGAVVVDADVIARGVVEPGGPAYDGVVERFGPSVLLADGRLDRPALAAIVFNDEEARVALNAITWPAIGVEVLRRAAEAPPGSVVVMDVPLIAEGQKLGTGRTYDVVIVVEAPREVRLARLEARGVSRDDAERRMAVQATDEERRALADFVIDNGGDLATVEAQVAAVWDELVRLQAAKNASL